MPKVLIIDDEQSIRNSLRDILEYENYEVEDVDNAIKGLEKISANLYDAILCDIKMPRMDGLEFLSKAYLETDSPIIMISGHGTIDTAIEAIKKGAYDYISKPFDLNRLLVTLRNAMDKSKLVVETQKLKKKISQSNQIIGNSKPMIDLLEMVDKIAKSDARVLICGPNGSGKELIARRIYENSLRSQNAFVEVNCAAIPSELIESELFGHEKGSFTSAIKQRKGNFEQANDGTLFLDEVGDMSLSAQAKVLRALQENKITRVGGEKGISVNVRVIAATNKDLRKEILAGNFREDLYHRLSVIVVNVPGLNERLEDIPLLVKYFVKEIASNEVKKEISIDDDAIKYIQQVDWTGNVRELRNIVERLVILCDKKITKQDVIKYANK